MMVTKQQSEKKLNLFYFIGKSTSMGVEQIFQSRSWNNLIEARRWQYIK